VAERDGGDDGDPLRELAEDAPDRLHEALRRAPHIPEHEIDAFVRAGGSVPMRRDSRLPAAELTPRELEVLGALSHGLEYKMAAETLGLSLHTVKERARSARYRLRAKNTLHAVAIALRRGLLS